VQVIYKNEDQYEEIFIPGDISPVIYIMWRECGRTGTALYG
jgi:hypothetical protein